MRFLFWMLCVFPALAVPRAEMPVVDVVVPAIALPIVVAFYQAEGIAVQIYSDIGVRLRWRRAGQNPETPDKEMRCTITVDLYWETPPSVYPGALAIAKPYTADEGSPEVAVFMDRIQPIAEANPTASASVLGHVLAHELGHVLQGTDRHSETGVLKAHWSIEETRRMQAGRLRFTDYDAALILEALRNRRCGSVHSKTGLTNPSSIRSHRPD